MTGPGPLDGVRVLDFSRVLSGPHCTRMLSDLGAEVIKVEPPEGDMTRYSFPRVNSIATYFTQQNCGKRNISLDLRQPRGRRDPARADPAQCDVVLENFRPGVMDRIGLGYEALSRRAPRPGLRLAHRLRLDRAVERIAGRTPPSCRPESGLT